MFCFYLFCVGFWVFFCLFVFLWGFLLLFVFVGGGGLLIEGRTGHCRRFLNVMDGLKFPPKLILQFF